MAENCQYRLHITLAQPTYFAKTYLLSAGRLLRSRSLLALVRCHGRVSCLKFLALLSVLLLGFVKIKKKKKKAGKR